MQQSALPFELTDNIIDHLHNDSAALNTCALVCKGWLSASRFHLLESVCIRSPSTMHALKRATKSSPAFTGSIRGLQIVDGTNWPDRDSSGVQTDVRWAYACFASFDAVLPRLQSLSLVNLRLDSDWDHRALMFRLEHNFREVTKLALTDCRFASSDCAVQFLRSYQQLASLTLGTIYTGAPPSHYDSGRKKIPLQHLTIAPAGPHGYRDGTAVFLRWLRLHTTATGNLRSLVVQLPDPVDSVEEISEIFAATGHSLRELTFAPHRWYTFADRRKFAEDALLTRCTSLRSLTLHLTWERDCLWGGWVKRAEVLPAVLLSVCSPHLHRVNIQLTTRMMEELELCTAWAKVDDAFATHLPYLDAVAVTVNAPVNIARCAVEQAIREALPRVCALGTLNIRVESDQQ